MHNVFSSKRELFRYTISRGSSSINATSNSFQKRQEIKRIEVAESQGQGLSKNTSIDVTQTKENESMLKT